jgi:predicted nucleic acid-binding protein
VVRWILDTSVIIAMEGDDDIAPFPIGEHTVSVVTIGELAVGLHLDAPEDASFRIELIAEIEHTWNPIPVDIRIMRRFATMVASCRRRGIRPGMADAIIAATASVHGLGVVTCDRDFGRFEGIDVVYV